MGWIIGWSLRNRRAIVGSAIVVVLLGIWLTPTMKSDVVPDFTPTTVEVQTEALGLSASEVEQLITVPLEQDLLNGVAWMTSIRSRSIPGLSSIEMIFEPGTPMLRARQVVAERLVGAAALPNVSKPPQMLQPVSSASRVMMVGVSSPTLSAIDLGVLARWTLRPSLLGVDGVANVAIFGQRERQLQVQIDPAVLAERGIGIDQILQTTGNALWVSPLTYLEASTPGAGGFIETPNQRLTVQHESPIVSAAQLSAVAVEGAEGLTLGDITTVVEDHQPLIGEAVFSDEPGLLLVVEKYPGQSTAEVADRVGDALELLQPGLEEVTLDTEIYEPTRYVERSIRSIQVAVAIGAVLAAIVLLGLFLDWRTVLIAGAAMASSLAAAGMVLYARNATINSMVFAGIGLAMVLVVDDAVSSVAAVTRRLRRPAPATGEESTLSALVGEGLLEQRSASAYALAITVVIAIPLLLVDGLSAESFFPPMARSFLLAAVASALVALTVVPALCLLVFARTASKPDVPRSLGWVSRNYDRHVGPQLHRSRIALGALAAVLVVGVVGFSRLDADMIPRFRETDLLIHVEAAPGTSLDSMRRVAESMQSDLQLVEGVRRVGSHLGRAITSDQVVNVSSGELWVRIDDDADYDRAIKGIHDVIDGHPGVRAELLTYIGERLNDEIRPQLAPIDVRIFGEDREALIAKAEEVRQRIAEIDGIENPRVVIAPNEPSMRIEVDLEAAQQAGLLPGDIRRTAATLLQGLEVGNLFEDQRVFEVVVLGTPELRQSLTTVENLLLVTPDGGQVRLGDVASVTIAPTPTVIERDASARVIDVLASIDGRSLDAVSADVSAAIAEIQFPLANHAELIGDYEEHRDAVRRLLVIALVAVVLVVLLLHAATSSWTLAGLMALTVAASVLGGIIVILIDGGEVTIGHAAGLVRRPRPRRAQCHLDRPAGTAARARAGGRRSHDAGRADRIRARQLDGDHHCGVDRAARAGRSAEQPGGRRDRRPDGVRPDRWAADDPGRRRLDRSCPLSAVRRLGPRPPSVRRRDRFGARHRRRNPCLASASPGSPPVSPPAYSPPAVRATRPAAAGSCRRWSTRLSAAS